MQFKDAIEINNLLNKSPIRLYKSRNSNISFFEDEKNKLNEIDRIIRINKENMENKLKIVVLGEVKAGKSTFINALIGRKVSYTNVVEATAAILEIEYSEEEKIMIYRNNKENIILDSLSKLDEMLDVNKKDQKFFSEIKKILISVKSDRLKDIVLVDTPGLNTITKENEERTEKYISNSDVILWIMNADHLGQIDVTEKINSILDYGKPIICVLNRIDEVNAKPEELIEYVQDNMGYMFEEIFAISAKTAWDGYCENNTLKISESNINKLYKYIVNNIEKNSQKVHEDSILQSMKVQVKKDLYVHEGANIRIDLIVSRFNYDIRELKKYNDEVKRIIKDELNEWFEREFFKEEREVLENCKNDNEFTTRYSEYVNDEYILNVLNDKYKELSNFLLEEWQNNTKVILNRNVDYDIDFEKIINKKTKLDIDSLNNEVIINGAKQGGMTAAAVGTGIAGYSALFGPAAASVTLLGALTTILPPLLIAGVIGGAVFNIYSTEKKQLNIKNQIDSEIVKIKNEVENSAIIEIKKNLDIVSDSYLKNSIESITLIIEQCDVSLDELKKINKKIEEYIKNIKKVSLNFKEFNIIHEGIKSDNSQNVCKKEVNNLKDKVTMVKDLLEENELYEIENTVDVVNGFKEDNLDKLLSRHRC